MLGLASEWRFEKGDRKSYSGSAQNPSVRTNLVKATIDESQGDSLCRVCRKIDESIDHVLSGCSKLARKEYKRRHDNLEGAIPKQFGNRLKQIRITAGTAQVQKAVFLGTAMILRKVLEM